MLGFFRSFFQSKVGVVLTLGFLALIALAFASADISGSNAFGGVAGGDRVATVGKQTIAISALSQAASSGFERARQENAGLTMQRFVAAGAVGQILDDLIDRNAVFEFARRHGMTASDRLVDSEIVKIPAFQGPDGRFSQQTYRQVLSQQRLTDQLVRDNIAQGLAARQLLVPVGLGARMPGSLAQRYASFRNERRRGEIVVVPSAAFAPKAAPGDPVLQRFYAANRAAYTRPERRVIRYASFGEEALKDGAPPSEAEIAKAYAARRADYAPSETRTVQHVVLPTQAAAAAFVAELRKGAGLEAAARAKGLLPTTGAVTRQALSAQASPAVADAVFAAARGAIVGPARSGLGWHVARIEAITAKPGKSLDQARPEIVAQLSVQKRRTALSDLSSRIEEQFDQGATLSDAAKDMGLTVATTEPLTANGQVFGKPGANAPAELARVLPTAFLMERENEPQLAEVEPGKHFVMFDVAEIVSAAPPPFGELREQLARDWAVAEGFGKARAAADKLIAALARRVPLADAARTIGAPLPPADRVDMSREELAKAQPQVPPPLALMFSMAKGTAKRLAAPARQGWIVVKLDEIVPGTSVLATDQLAALQAQLGGLVGREYAEQFRRAVRQEVGVRRNPAAIRTVTQQLTGGTGGE